MRGLKDLIDAVGGIEVNNKIDFTLMVFMYLKENKRWMEKRA